MPPERKEVGLKTMEPSAAARLRTAGLDLIRARLMSGLASSQSHALRGILNTIVLSGEVLLLSCAGDDAASVKSAGVSLRGATTRFRDAFERFLGFLVATAPDCASSHASTALGDIQALLEPLARERAVRIEVSARPEALPKDPLPGTFVLVLALAVLEVLAQVGDGGRLSIAAQGTGPASRIVISGDPSAPPGPLPEAIEDIIAACGGARSGAPGPGFAFEVPVAPW